MICGRGVLVAGAENRAAPVVELAARRWWRVRYSRRIRGRERDAELVTRTVDPLEDHEARVGWDDPAAIVGGEGSLCDHRFYSVVDALLCDAEAHCDLGLGQADRRAVVGSELVDVYDQPKDLLQPPGIRGTWHSMGYNRFVAARHGAPAEVL